VDFVWLGALGSVAVLFWLVDEHTYTPNTYNERSIGTIKLLRPSPMEPTQANVCNRCAVPSPLLVILRPLLQRLSCASHRSVHATPIAPTDYGDFVSRDLPWGLSSAL
jgi:hypothetical protein